MTRKHTTSTSESQPTAEPVTTIEPAAEAVEQPATEPVELTSAEAQQPEQSPARTAAEIRSAIGRIRAEFIGTYQSRASVLEDAITRKRADIAAERILTLEATLPPVAGKP